MQNVFQAGVSIWPFTPPSGSTEEQYINTEFVCFRVEGTSVPYKEGVEPLADVGWLWDELIRL